MRLYVLGGLIAVALVFCFKWTLEWFRRLEVESFAQAYEGLLEQPDKLQKVPAPSLFENATKTLSIVIPAYNEAERLPPTLEETLQYLQHRRDKEGSLFTYEVVVVDDGSTDGTAKAAFEAVRKYGFDAVRVLRLPGNKGKGAAVKAGMLITRGQSALFMDADGATKVSDVEKLEAELQRSSSGTKAEALGMVVGSRAHLEKEAIAKRHWYRNFLMRGFHMLVLFVAGGAVKDTQCGFKLFSRQAARLLYSNQRLQRWCFDVELLFLAQRFQIPVREVAVKWAEIPGSKIKFTSIIHMSWELVAIMLGYSLKVWEIRMLESLQKKQT